MKNNSEKCPKIRANQGWLTVSICTLLSGSAAPFSAKCPESAATAGHHAKNVVDTTKSNVISSKTKATSNSTTRLASYLQYDDFAPVLNLAAPHDLAQTSVQRVYHQAAIGPHQRRPVVVTTNVCCIRSQARSGKMALKA